MKNLVIFLLVIMVVTEGVFLMIFHSEKVSLRAEAIKNGYAEWVVDPYGNKKFAWKFYVEKPK